MLNAENYKKGFLVDEDLMAGVTEDPNQPGFYVAFVLRHTTGEYLGYQPFHDLGEALGAINKVERSWSYEAVGGCGGDCGKDGGSCKGNCRKSHG